MTLPWNWESKEYMEDVNVTDLMSWKSVRNLWEEAKKVRHSLRHDVRDVDLDAEHEGFSGRDQ